MVKETNLQSSQFSSNVIPDELDHPVNSITYARDLLYFTNHQLKSLNFNISAPYIDIFRNHEWK